MPIMKRLTVDGVNYDTVGEASVTQVQTSGTKIATVTIDGTATDLYAPEGGGGGSTVTVTQTLASGTDIASISVDGTSTTLYAPTPPTVPSASSTTPSMDGTAAVGAATTYARADHVHPTDTSRQATLVSGTNIKTINGTSILGSGDITTPTYTLPTASTSTLGGVKVDGLTITITDGVISSSGGGGGGSELTLYTDDSFTNLWIDAAKTTTLLESFEYDYDVAKAEMSKFSAIKIWDRYLDTVYFVNRWKVDPVDETFEVAFGLATYLTVSGANYWLLQAKSISLS